VGNIFTGSRKYDIFDCLDGVRCLGIFRFTKLLIRIVNKAVSLELLLARPSKSISSISYWKGGRKQLREEEGSRPGVYGGIRESY
jgi:hypothetical protein